MAKKLTAILILVGLVAVFFNYKSFFKLLYPRHYNAFVAQYSDQYKLNDNLVYSLIKIESKFNPYALSGKEASGLMQITPQTADYIAALIGDQKPEQKDLMDPATNIKYGCFYFSKLLKDFGGDLNCALAAYNGGEGNVRKWLRSKTEHKKTLEPADIPFSETRKYVKLVNRNYRIYQQLYSGENAPSIHELVQLIRDTAGK